MSERELKELKKALKDRQKEVKTSKEAANKSLLQAGITTSNGNYTKPFKSLKKP